MPGYVDIGRSEVDILELGSLGYLLLLLFFFQNFQCVATQIGKQVFYNYFGHELEFSSTTKQPNLSIPLLIKHLRQNIFLYELGRSPCS